MIGYIKGKIVSQYDSIVIIETAAGVGYEVNLVISDVDLNNDDIELFTYTNVSENDLSLWGFADRAQLKLFKSLLNVSGVGLRTAQAIMQTLGTSQIINAIKTDDYTGLKAPGVGKKTAERIIIDLRNKIDDLAIELGTQDTSLPGNELVEDAVAAVVSLGYNDKDVRAVIRELDTTGYVDTQSLIKELLKHV